MNKLIVSDYDQTFYINDEDIERNKKNVAVFRNLGNIFAFATGRSYVDFQRKVKLYNLKYDYAVLNHGTTIIDADDNVLLNLTIPNIIKDELINDLELQSNDYFCSRCFEKTTNLNYDDLTKINVQYKNEEEALAKVKQISYKYQNYLNVYYVNNNMIEVISNKTNKKDAILFLIDKIGVLKDNVYTIGDGYSDIEMVDYFNGYAMENSVAEIKECAKGIYTSVSNLIKDILDDKI